MLTDLITFKAETADARIVLQGSCLLSFTLQRFPFENARTDTGLGTFRLLRRS